MDTNPSESTIQSLGTPIAIVIAGALLAAAVYFSGGTGPAQPAKTTPQTAEKFIPVAAGEHIFGNPNAPVKIIEYTDLECPFCKQFHGTMQQIMNEYGASGKVAWVMRNFPLEQLHPNAPKLAQAAECVAEVGGNDAYWAFLDEIIKRSPINTFFDLNELNAAVTAVGVSVQPFTTCLESGKYKALVDQQIQDAIASGGTGTPHNILVKPDGSTELIPGSQPYAAVKDAIDRALK